MLVWRKEAERNAAREAFLEQFLPVQHNAGGSGFEAG
jgi:hypothetical protein